MKKTLRFLFVILLICHAAITHAATWTGSGPDDFWNTTNNWLGDVVPLAGESVLFPSATAYTVNISGAAPTVGPVTFNASSSYTLNSPGDVLTLSDNFLQNGSGAVQVNATLDLGLADRTFGGTGSGPVNLSQPVTDAGAAGRNLTFSQGRYTLGNNGNSFNSLTIQTGAVVTLAGTGDVAGSGVSSFVGKASYVNILGGTLDDQHILSINGTNVIGPLDGNNGTRGIYFGAAGGTLLLTNLPLVTGPQNFLSDATNGTPGKIVVNQFTPAFDETAGLSLGTFGVATPQGVINGDLSVVLSNGANAFLCFTNQMNGVLRVYGQPGGQVPGLISNAVTGINTNVGRFSIRVKETGTIPGWPRAFYNPAGIQFYDAVEVFVRHSEMTYLASDVTLQPGAKVDFSGGRTNNNRILNIGYTNLVAPFNLNIRDGAVASMNLQNRNDVSQSNRPGRGIRIWSQINLDAGATIRFYRGFVDTTSTNGVIEVMQPIVGAGTPAKESLVLVDLPFATDSRATFSSAVASSGINGINFNGTAVAALGGNVRPGAALVINGTGTAGLRVQGSDVNLTNLLTQGANKTRLRTISGTGGTLTIAITNSATFTINDGPTNAATVVQLGFDNQGGNAAEYVLTTTAAIGNWGGFVLKNARLKPANGFAVTKPLTLLGGTLFAADAATITMGSVTLNNDAVLEMGNAGGAATTVNFSSSSGNAWTAGKFLIVSNWNGSTSGGGPDVVKFGVSPGGLTAGQLAQIKWINPFGAGDLTGAEQLASGEIVPLVAPVSLNAASGNPPITPFQSSVTGIAGAGYIIQANTNLNTTNWINILTNTGSFNFIDQDSTNYPMRYYRVKGQ